MLPFGVDPRNTLAAEVENDAPSLLHPFHAAKNEGAISFGPNLTPARYVLTTTAQKLFHGSMPLNLIGGVSSNG